MANIIEEKSFAFAIRVVNLYKHLNETKKEFVLSKQLLRSGTRYSFKPNAKPTVKNKKPIMASGIR